MRISSPVTPRAVLPPLSPWNAGWQGGEYTDSIWRGGLPKHWPFGGRRSIGGSCSMMTSPVVGSTLAPAPLPLACLRLSKIVSALFGSGGASGENWADVVAWSGGGRSTLGSRSAATTSAPISWPMGNQRSAGLPPC